MATNKVTKNTAAPTAGQKAAATKAAKKNGAATAEAKDEGKAKPAAKTPVKAAAVKPAAKAAPAKVSAKAAAKPETESEDTGESDGPDDEVGSPMTRKDLAQAVRERVIAGGMGLPEKLAMTVVESVEEVVKEAVAAGRTINLTGFGKFVTKLRPAGTARNPQTGQAVERPASYAVAFKPAKGLKEAAASRTPD